MLLKEEQLMNPIFNQNSNNAPRQQSQTNPMDVLQQILEMGTSPEMILQTIASRNPQANNIMQQIKQSGMSPRDFVMQYAKQNNINLNPIMKMLGQKGIKL